MLYLPSRGYFDIISSCPKSDKKPPVLKFNPNPEVKSKMFGKPSEPSHQSNIVWREVVLLQPQISHLSRSQLNIAVIHGPRMNRLNRFQPPCFGAVPYLCLFDGHGFVLWMSTWRFPSNCTDTQRRRWLSETGRKSFQRTRDQLYATWACTCCTCPMLQIRSLIHWLCSHFSIFLL